VHEIVFKTRKTATTTYKMLKLSFRGEAVSKIHLYDWIFKLKSSVSLGNSKKHLQYLSMTRMDHHHNSTTVIGYLPCSKERASVNVSNSGTVIGLLQVIWELLWKGLYRVEGNCSYHREENRSGNCLISSTMKTVRRKINFLFINCCRECQWSAIINNWIIVT
jgi:hypothetical protein